MYAPPIVVVSNVSGIAPVATIVAPATTTSASSVNLVATATDSDGSVVGVEFFLNRNSIGQATRDQQANTWRLTTSFAGIAPGSTEVVAIVRDSAGNLAASATSKQIQLMEPGQVYSTSFGGVNLNQFDLRASKRIKIDRYTFEVDADA